jgi:hypothetical protein
MAWSAPVELGEWLPDQPQLSAPALLEAQGVIPRGRGYDPWPGSVDANRGTLDTFCRGAFSGRTRQGTDFVVAGTTAKLWLATNGLLDDATRTSGGPYTAQNRWEFALFGEDLIAVDYEDAPQRFQFGVSTDFALLHANAPKARFCATVREFLVMGNLVGQGTHVAIYGTREDGVHWSGQGNAASWETTGTAAAAAVQSDWQALIDEGGAITDVVGGADYGLVFKERSIWRMDYEGGDTFFRFTQIDGNRGCTIPGSCIRIAGLTYFLSETGLCVTNGADSRELGTERVDRWLLDRITADRYERVSSFNHPKLPLLGFGFMTNQASGDTCDEILLYNYAIDRFSHVTLSHEWMVIAIPNSASVSLDSAPYAAGNLDTTYATLDLDSLVGGMLRELSFFDSSHHLQSVNGTPSVGVIVTGDFELSPGAVSFVRAVRPLYEARGSSFNALVGARMRTQDVSDLTAFAVEDASGKCCGRKTGRYHRARLQMDGAYEQVHGLSADFETMGER